MRFLSNVFVKIRKHNLHSKKDTNYSELNENSIEAIVDSLLSEVSEKNFSVQNIATRVMLVSMYNDWSGGLML